MTVAECGAESACDQSIGRRVRANPSRGGLQAVDAPGGANVDVAMAIRGEAEGGIGREALADLVAREDGPGGVWIVDAQNARIFGADPQPSGFVNMQAPRSAIPVAGLAAGLVAGPSPDRFEFSRPEAVEPAREAAHPDVARGVFRKSGDLVIESAGESFGGSEAMPLPVDGVPIEQVVNESGDRHPHATS